MKRPAIVDRGRVVAEGAPDQLKSELDGEAVLGALAEPATEEHVRAAARRLDGRLCEVALDRRTLLAWVDTGATILPAVLAALDYVGIAVAAVTVAQPSLDDVYLRHAGREFTDTDREGAR